jgi:CubicO group peptidase (beta-lactamase class C family)
MSVYYRAGLPVEIEPGTKWVYSNHGFAALGQIVEDVTGDPLDRYLREQLFAPLGMEHTDLVRSERVRERLAKGYVLRSRGLKAVADREVLTPGGSGVYASAADIARYVAALLRITSGEQESVLTPRALAEMFQPHFQPDPRVPGMGLGFELSRDGDHRVVRKGGTMSGFCRRSRSRPTKGSASWSSPTPAVWIIAGSQSRLPGRFSAGCSGYRTRRSAPTSRPIRKSGTSCAAGTRPTQGR